MAVNPLMTVGLNGIQQGLKGMKRAAQDVAELNLDDRASATAARDESNTTGPSVAPFRTEGARTDGTQHDTAQDAAEAITDLRVHARRVQLAARVVKTADEVLGFLIDVRA